MLGEIERLSRDLIEKANCNSLAPSKKVWECSWTC